MKSYGDLDDRENDVNGQGCLQPVLVLIIIAAAVGALLLSGCESSPPKFQAAVVRPDGKAVALIYGTADTGESWAARNLGPILGGLASGIGAALKILMPPTAALP